MGFSQVRKGFGDTISHIPCQPIRTIATCPRPSQPNARPKTGRERAQRAVFAPVWGVGARRARARIATRF